MVVRNNRYALVPPCQFSTKILYYAPWAIEVASVIELSEGSGRVAASFL